jgi:hypothetical protein
MVICNMNRICLHGQLIAFALLGLACGPPRLAGDADTKDADAEAGSSGGESSSSSSSSSSSEAGTGETSTSETGTHDTFATMGFVPEEDEMWGDECDPFAQDCPDGEKCVPYALGGGNWNALKCVPVTGDQAVGESCTYAGTVESTDDCDAASFCWNADQEGMGTCHLFCTGTADNPECPADSYCALASDGVITLCIPTCDPILQDCNEGFACYWGNNDFVCIFTTQDIPPGDPCGFVNDCVEGTGCIDATFVPGCVGAACCSPFCQLGADDQACAVLPGTTCVSFFEDGMAPPGKEHIGMCLSPP